MEDSTNILSALLGSKRNSHFMVQVTSRDPCTALSCEQLRSAPKCHDCKFLQNVRMCLPFLLFCILILFSFLPSGPLLQLSHAAIIHNLDATHFTSDLHVTGDLFTGNYQNAPLETLKVNVSNCEGRHRLRLIGHLADPYPASPFSPGVFLNGELYYLEYRALVHLNLDDLIFHHVPGLDSPYIAINESRARVAMFSPRDDSNQLYIAAGNNAPETLSYNTTWMVDLNTLQWTQKSSHPFLTVMPQSGCSLDRCYVQGGLSNIAVAETVYNILYEYDYILDAWKEITPPNSAYVYGNGFHYLPHLDSLVSFGGVGCNYASNPLVRRYLEQVSVYSLGSLNWIHSPFPVQQFLPMSVVYKDAIYIAAAMLEPPSRLLKLTFDESGPSYHHIIFENEAILPTFPHGQIGGLIGDHILFMGGFESTAFEGTKDVMTEVFVLSLC